MRKELQKAAEGTEPTTRFAVDFPRYVGDLEHDWGGDGFSEAPLIGIIIAASEGQGITSEPSMADAFLSTSMHWSEKSGWRKWTTVYCGFDNELGRWRSILTERISLDEYKGHIGAMSSSAVSQDLRPSFAADRFDLALQYLLALEDASINKQGNQNAGFDWLQNYAPNFDPRELAKEYGIELEPNTFLQDVIKAKLKRDEKFADIKLALEGDN